MIHGLFSVCVCVCVCVCLTKETPHLTLLDGHHSHKTLAATDFCRERGILKIKLLPHSTDKLHPLDMAYIKSLKCVHNACADGG